MIEHVTSPRPLQVALAAAEASARLLRRGFGRVHQVSHKGLVDLVTEQDRRSEETIVAMIRQAFPDHAILAEESGRNGQSATCRWIVDPLDGTTNYAHGYPVFCVSIAYEEAGQLTLGVIVDVLRRERFVAQRGQGATLNGRPIQVSATETLIESLVETGFPYDRARMARALAQFNQLAYLTQGLRRAGAAALDLAYVAAGRADGFWEATISPWDVAAGALLVQEAGGTVSRLDGSPYRVDCTEIAATNGRIHAALIDALAGV
jgi:myo-inositol-1(or 4)-monophosphatase